MMLRKSQKKKEDETSAEEKKVRKNGKAIVAGGSVGTGRHEPSSDNGNPDLDIDRAMLMNAKPLKFDKTAPSSKHLGVKPQARKTPHALTVAVAASSAATAAKEDTTGSQTQSQEQEQAEPPAKRKSRKKATSSAPAEPPPPSPASPTHTEPPPPDSDEDEESAEEDVTGRRKKTSITQMIKEHQVEELADWWRELPCQGEKGQADSRQSRGDGGVGLQCQDACWLDEEHDDHVWQGREEGQGEVWVCSPRPHL